MKKLFDYLCSMIEGYVLPATLMLILLFIMTGCTSKRSSIANTVIEQEEIKEEKLSILAGRDIKLSDLIETDMGIRINYVRYDSSKPPDSTTNKPPVIEEGSVDLTLNQKHESGSNIRDSTTVNSESYNKKEGKEQTSETNESVVNGSGWMEKIMICGVILLSLFISIKILLRLMKKYLESS